MRLEKLRMAQRGQRRGRFNREDELSIRSGVVFSRAIGVRGKQHKMIYGWMNCHGERSSWPFTQSEDETVVLFSRHPS